MDEKVAKTPRPHMLDADEVAELLRIKKGSAYEVIRRINAEQEARGRVVIRGRVRSDVFDCFASMFVRQVRQCFSVVWADGFPRCRHRFPVM